MTPRICLTMAAVLGFLAVFCGAFAAHGLKDSGYLERQHAEAGTKIIVGMTVPAAYKYLQDFETGVRYHMWHVLAMAITGLMMRQRAAMALSVAAICFASGIVCFSGSLYVIAVGGPRFAGIPWGMVAPIGGTLLMVGWLALAIGAWRSAANDY